MNDTLQTYYDKHNYRLPTKPIPDEAKTLGRPRILNNPLIPKDHICGKCKEDNTKVGFKVQNGKAGYWCNDCNNNRKYNTPKVRRANISKRINEYQGIGK